MSLIFFNHQLISPDQLSYTETKRWLYGDALFESIRCRNKNIPLLDWHVNRLTKSASELHLNLPIIDWQEAISKTVESNELTKDIRARIVVWRKYGELYSPKGNEVNVMIEVTPLSVSTTPNHLKVGIFNDYLLPTNQLDNLKSGNALVYVMAKAKAAKQQVDELLLLNHRNEIAEASSSNIFFVKGEQLYTSPLSSGCVDGVLRNYLIEHYNVKEMMLSIEKLNTFDEAFCTNAVKLVQPIKEIGEVSFNARLSLELYRALNDLFK